MPEFFEFEADFVDSLRCIPMQVRFKLDTCGIKLKLPQWNKFNQRDRELLVELPCQSPAEIQTYRTTLEALIQQRSGEPASTLTVDPTPPWLDATIVPVAVSQKAAETGIAIAPDQWAELSPLQRFALIKLSLSNHENSNFFPALQEFGLT